MDITINRPRDGLHASQELIVRAAQEAKQLDDASVWMLKQLRQLTNVIPMTGGLPVVLAIQSKCFIECWSASLPLMTKLDPSFNRKDLCLFSCRSCPILKEYRQQVV